MITAYIDGPRRRQGDRHGCTRRSGTSTSARTSRRPPKSAIRRAVARGFLHRAGGLRCRLPRRRRLQFFINPLVNWVWLGFGVHGVRHGIALLPEKAYCVRAGEGPGRSGHDGVLLLALVLGRSRCRSAQDEAGANGRHPAEPWHRAATPRTDIEQRLRERIVCLCGGCGKEPIGDAAPARTAARDAARDRGAGRPG